MKLYRSKMHKAQSMNDWTNEETLTISKLFAHVFSKSQYKLVGNSNTNEIIQFVQIQIDSFYVYCVTTQVHNCKELELH